MRWQIRGADASSGDERVMVVESFSQEEAESKARYAGMLISSVEREQTAPVVSYALPEQQRAAVPQTPRHTPLPYMSSPAESRDSRAILQLVRWVRIASTLLIAYGLLRTGLAAWNAFNDLVRDSRDYNVLAAFFHVAEELYSGFIIIVPGLMLRLLAAIAMVIRDIGWSQMMQGIARETRTAEVADRSVGSDLQRSSDAPPST